MDMKRKIALLLAAAMTVMTFTGCSSSTSSEAGKPKPELNIIVAHNQTSMENPYTKAAIDVDKRQGHCWPGVIYWRRAVRPRYCLMT